jgi:hypothetical protein
MFNYYVNKVMGGLGRMLSDSEMAICRDFLYHAYPISYAIEYFK